jgi:hypothetical protein
VSKGVDNVAIGEAILCKHFRPRVDQPVLPGAAQPAHLDLVVSAQPGIASIQYIPPLQRIAHRYTRAFYP